MTTACTPRAGDREMLASGCCKHPPLRAIPSNAAARIVQYMHRLCAIGRSGELTWRHRRRLRLLRRAAAGGRSSQEATAFAAAGGDQREEFTEADSACRGTGGDQREEFTEADSVCRGGRRPEGRSSQGSGGGCRSEASLIALSWRDAGACLARGRAGMVPEAPARPTRGCARRERSPPRCPGPVPSREWRGHRGHPVRSRVLCAPAFARCPSRAAASPPHPRPRSATSSRTIQRPALPARIGRGAATRCDA